MTHDTARKSDIANLAREPSLELGTPVAIHG